MIVRNSALEFLLAFVLLFAVVTIVRWVAGPSPVSADRGGDRPAGHPLPR
ncbi:hypothetical protein [Peterkaempfera bronchialis]|nr:hypothetical protein [Peterkaempfera bronchialis]